MRIFAVDDLGSAAAAQMAALQREIEAEPKNRLLNVNEAEYVGYLVQKHRLEPLVFLWDKRYVTDREAVIPAERFPEASSVFGGESCPKQVIKYHIPFTGEADLLKMRPSTRLLSSPIVDVSGDEISFEIVNWRNDSEQIARDAEGMIAGIRQQNEHVTREVAQFNASLPAAVEAAVQGRKQQHLQQSRLLESLGVPVRRSERTPGTFAVPTVKRRVLVKPTAPDVAYAPEPTLDASLYWDILGLCRDTGREMERHPSIYDDKDEETLRDHFIMVLSPHFDSVTGETFNKTGKTDIIVRHESASVFVAECKFWSGARAFERTIDQALGYLTWRDSKAAIILFVRNREFGAVLEQIEPAAETHRCYVSTGAPGDEGWFNFNFHLLNDSTRGVRLGVLCFHLPPA